MTFNLSAARQLRCLCTEFLSIVGCKDNRDKGASCWNDGNYVSSVAALIGSFTVDLQVYIILSK